MQKGVLKRFPQQIDRKDLIYDEGVDIVYSLKGMTPAKFREYSEILLQTAYTEAERYKEEKYRFARFEVEINRVAKGRKSTSPIRDYTAAKHTDSDVMVFGEEKLGYTIPEGFRKPYLINKVDQILSIPDEYPGSDKQRPYKVLTMIISIRAGIRETMAAIEKSLKEDEERTIKEEEMKPRKDSIKACEKCGSNRWKTKVKGKTYECRNCGHIRNT